MLNKTFLGQLFYIKQGFRQPSVARGNLNEIAGIFQNELAAQDAKVMLNEATKKALRQDKVLQDELQIVFPMLYQKLKPTIDSNDSPPHDTDSDVIVIHEENRALAYTPSAPPPPSDLSDSKVAVAESRIVRTVMSTASALKSLQSQGCVSQSIDYSDQVEGQPAPSLPVKKSDAQKDFKNNIPKANQDQKKDQDELEDDVEPGLIKKLPAPPAHKPGEKNNEKHLVVKFSLLPAPPTHRPRKKGHEKNPKKKVVASLLA